MFFYINYTKPANFIHIFNVLSHLYLFTRSKVESGPVKHIDQSECAEVTYLGRRGPTAFGSSEARFSAL